MEKNPIRNGEGSIHLRKGRKIHRCSHCGAGILIGVIHVENRSACYNDWQSGVRYHIDCSEEMRREDLKRFGTPAGEDSRE